MGRFKKIAALLMLSVPFSLANATSRGVDPVRKQPACEVRARFIEAKPKLGKAVWIFDRIDPSTPLAPACAGVSSTFEVWIWSGSFSTLSNSLVYPLSITEPKAGEEYDLKLDHKDIREMPTKVQKKKTIVSGWFLAPESNALKARTR